MFKVNIWVWFLIAALAGITANTLKDGVSKDSAKEVLPSQLQEKCKDLFSKPEERSKCLADVQLYTNAIVTRASRILDITTNSLPISEYELMLKPTGNVSQLRSSRPTKNINDIDARLLANSITLNELNLIRNKFEQIYVIQGVLQKPLGTSFSSFEIIPVENYGSDTGRGIEVEHIAFGSKESERLAACNFMIGAALELSAFDHPCFGSFILKFSIDGSDEVIALERTLLGLKLDGQGYSNLRSTFLDEKGKEAHKFFNEQWVKACRESYKSDLELSRLETASLKNNEIFTSRCTDSIFYSSVLLSNSGYSKTGKSIKVQKEVSAILNDGISKNISDLSGCLGTNQEIMSYFTRSKMQPNSTDPEKSQSVDHKLTEYDTKKMKVLGRTISIPTPVLADGYIKLSFFHECIQS